MLRFPLRSIFRAMLRAPTTPAANSFNPLTAFGADTLWHFGTPDYWWSAYQRSLGTEGVDGGFVTPAGYDNTTTQNSVSSFTATAGTTVARVACPVTVAVVAGRTYLLKFRLTTAPASGNVTATVLSGATLGSGTVRATAATIATPDVRYLQFTATVSETVNVLLASSVAATGFAASDVSIREIDLSKIQLWQDPAGTLPVTGPGQTWGLLLDAANGLARGPERFSDVGVTFSGGSSRVSEGVYRVYSADGAYSIVGMPSGTGVVGGTYEISFTIDSVTIPGNGVSLEGVVVTPTFTGVGRKSCIVVLTNTSPGFKRVSAATDIQISNISIREIPGYHASQPGAPSRPLFTCRYNKFLNTEVLSTQDVTTNAGAHVLSFTGAGTITLSGTATGAYSAGTHAITCTAGTLTATVAGAVTQADLRLSIHANIGKPYQRVTTATDMDQDGFPFYSWTDGIDDWAKTPVIPLGTMGVSAITVVNGVTKLSDAAQAILAEFSSNSTTTAGTLGIMAPTAAAAADFRSQSGGSVPGIAATASTLAAPIRSVLVAEGSIATDISRLTVNNGTPVLTATDQGTGNYTDQIQYLFRRDGTGLPFGGHWHGSTGVKRLLTDSEKSNLSAYYNRNVRGY